MKKLALISLLTGGLILLSAPRPADARVSVSVAFFHSELAPYGHWRTCSYGDCWAPAVAAGWQPYSNGEWIYTDYGWTWVSYDPWGGDPFHYGSWTWVAGDGWVWVPGTIWSPAWVTWCYSDAFIGWAPLPPTFAFSAAGYFGSPFVASARNYVIVPANRFAGGNVSTARIPLSRNTSVLTQARKATGFRASGGVLRNNALPLSRVERASSRAIPRRNISAARTDPRPMSASGSRRLTIASRARTERSAARAQTRSIARSAPTRDSIQRSRVSTRSRMSPRSTATPSARRSAARPRALVRSAPTRSASRSVVRSAPRRPESRPAARIEKAPAPRRSVVSQPMHERRVPPSAPVARTVRPSPPLRTAPSRISRPAIAPGRAPAMAHARPTPPATARGTEKQPGR